MENNKIKVLAVDDNQDNLTTISALVKEAFPDAAVFLALTGQKGLKLAAKEKPDVILLDIIMPGTDGFEVCRRLKANKTLSDIPVVFLTSLKADKEIRLKEMESGAEAFLAKPIDVVELTAQIRAMVKIRAANIEKRDQNVRLARLIQEKSHELIKENEERRKSERDLIEAQQLAHIGSFEFHMESNNLTCTDEGLRICGIKREEFSGAPDTIIQCIHPDDRDYTLQASEQTVSQKKTTTADCRLIKPNGEERFINLWFTPVLEANGKLKSVKGTVQDITARKRMEEDLRESEEKFKYLFDNSLVGKSITLISGEIQVNKAMCEMLGYSTEELQGGKWQEISHPDDIDFTQQQVDELLSGQKQSMHFNKRYIKKDGNVLWAEVLSSIRRDTSGKPLYFMTSIIDITERKQAEDALRQSEEKYQLLFNKAPLGYQLLDINCKLLEVNQQWLDLLGYTRNEVIGKCFDDLVSDECKEECQHCYQILNEQGFAQSEFEFITKNGTRLSITLKANLVYDAEGNIKQIHCLLQDITDQKKMQEALKESENLYRSFIDASTDMVFLKDDQFRHIVANNNLVEFFNKSKSEVIGKTDFELMSEEAAKQCRKADILAVTKKTAITSEEVIGGRVFETIKFPVELRNNKTGVGGFIHDITQRRINQDLLRASETRYRRLFESAKDGILILDADSGQIDDVNPYLTEMMGYSKEELIKKNIWEIGSFKDIIANRDNFIELQRKGYIRYENMPLQTEKGQNIEVEFVSNVYTVDNKKVIQCNIRDITERKRMEAEINRERNKASMYLETAAVILVALDREGRVTLINKKGCELLGYAQENIIGKNWIKNFIPKPEAGEIKLYFEQIISGGTQELEKHENFVITAGGEERLISWHNTVLYDEAGNATGLFSSGNDITERREAEEALKESEKKYSSYIENAPDGIFITDETGHYIEVNRAALQITGYSKEEFLGMTVRDITAVESRKNAHDHFYELLEKGLSRTSLQYIHKDGSTRWWLIDAVKLSEKRLLGFAKDITARKKSEEDLVHLSYHDQLTGLYNRRFFEEEMGRLDTKRNLPISIIMGDINGLKIINDSFGHAAGDEYLKRTAEIIKKVCRADDIIARLGGDEFVILLTKTEALETKKLINRLENLIF